MKKGNHSPSVLNMPVALSALEMTLLNDYQRGLPLTSDPFAEIARQAGVDVDEVIEALQSLQRRGLVSRVGPVFAPRRAGESTLAALSVDDDRLDEVAAFVSGFDEVNHNYQREHTFNLWFVITAPDRQRVDKVLAEIEAETGTRALDLPLVQSFYIDLGFPLWC